MAEIPRSPNYFKGAIIDAHRDLSQRRLNAADPVGGSARRPSSELVSTSALLLRDNGEAKRADERNRAAYEVARQAAAHEWGKDPKNAAVYRGIVAEANAKYETLLGSQFGQRSRDAVVVLACAQRAGFPEYEAWLAAREEERPPPRDGPDAAGSG